MIRDAGNIRKFTGIYSVSVSFVALLRPTAALPRLLLPRGGIRVLEKRREEKRTASLLRFRLLPKNIPAVASHR